MAILSAFTERKLRSDFAMTGEITLRGKILPVGGIREKVMAARRARLTNVILPAANQKDLVDLPRKALRGMNILFVETIDQVIEHVLLDPPPDGLTRPRLADSDEQDEP
jgi:ATP-dependent Lon protease